MGPVELSYILLETQNREKPFIDVLQTASHWLGAAIVSVILANEIS